MRTHAMRALSPIVLALAGSLMACSTPPGAGAPTVPAAPDKGSETTPAEASAPDATTRKARPDLQARIEARGYQGTFVVLDPGTNTLTATNLDWVDRGFVPASTFKIPNSLIALETGVADSPDFTLPWDGTERWFKSWNQDHSLRSAFAVSALWYYQEIARRVGEAQMQSWVSKARYGNTAIGGGIDTFWLNGDLRVTPAEQVDFLRRLHEGETPFSPDVVRTFLDEVMVYARAPGQLVRAKTGWAKSEDFSPESAAGFEGNLGWFVGSVEREGRARVYFAMLLTAPDPTPKAFGADRKALAFEFLGELGMMDASGDLGELAN